jgi:hypothetical protein
MGSDGDVAAPCRSLHRNQAENVGSDCWSKTVDGGGVAVLHGSQEEVGSIDWSSPVEEKMKEKWRGFKWRKRGDFRSRVLIKFGEFWADVEDFV